MKVLVTGTNGFLGFNLVKELLNLGHEVISISRRPLNFEHPALTAITCDLMELDKLSAMPHEIDVLYHTAASINFSNDFDALNDMTRSNILASGYIADFAIKYRIKKVVLSSSCSVYEENYAQGVKIGESYKLRPVNLYAVSKLSSEWVLQTKLEHSSCKLYILRYSSIYGAGQSPRSIVPIFIQQAVNRQPINIFGSGARIQDYVYIDDVVKANLSCLAVDLPNNTVLNIGSGEVISDLVLAQQIVAAWNSDVAIKILNENQLPETIFTFDIQKAQELISFRPLGLEQGLQAYHASQVSKL